MNRKLVLFDFDGTITTKDSFLLFIRFYWGTARFILGLIVLSPVLVLYALHIVPNWKAKEIVVSYFFRGVDVNTFNERCTAFSLNIIPTIVRLKALQSIEQYLDEGASIVVVTASAENWVKPWCTSQGLECIATKLAVENQKLSGKLQGLNCYGNEKVRRIKEVIKLSHYTPIIAYGDSKGDSEMLALASTSFYKPFRE